MKFFGSKKDFQEQDKQESIKKSLVEDIFDWADIIVFALIAVVICFTCFFRIVTIHGDSMKNSFYGGEKIIITNIGYRPAYGDVIVVSRNAGNDAQNTSRFAEPIIKRVIATGGEYVDIDFQTGKVYVGKISNRAEMTELNEPYASTPTNLYADVRFPVYVPEGYVFVLGDNRNDSKDSRFSEIGDNGLINEKYILGRAVFRIYPFDRIEKIKNPVGGTK